MCSFNRPAEPQKCSSCKFYTRATDYYGICANDKRIVRDRDGYGNVKPFHPPVLSNQIACYEFIARPQQARAAESIEQAYQLTLFPGGSNE